MNEKETHSEREYNTKRFQIVWIKVIQLYHLLCVLFYLFVYENIYTSIYLYNIESTYSTLPNNNQKKRKKERKNGRTTEGSK